MGVELPAEFAVSAPRSEAPSTATVDATGIGDALGRLGDAVTRHDKMLDVEADKTAARYETEALQGYASEAAKRAAADTGEPGYSGREIAHYDQAVAQYRSAPDIDPRTLKALNRRLDAQRLAVSNEAIAHEAKVAGALESQHRAAVEMSDDNNVRTSLAPVVQSATKTVDDAWDGRTPGYAASRVAAYDEAIKPTLDALPQEQRDRMQSELLSQRNQVYAEALGKEAQGQSAYIIASANQTADTATNMVLGNPEAFNSAATMVDQAAQVLPANMRENYVRDGHRELVVARLGSLLTQGKTDAVATELPEWKGLLTPQQYAGVQSGIRQQVERKDAADYMARSDMEGRTQAYLDGVMGGTMQPRPSDDEIKAALGAKGFADFQLQEKAAKTAKGSLGDFTVLSPEQMGARIDELKARVDAGGADYNLNSQILAAAMKAREGQLSARAGNPAGWALSGTTGTANDPSAIVRSSWDALQKANTPQGRMQAAERYARASLARQTQGGIVQPQLLPSDIAKSMVEAVAKAAPDQKGDAFQSLASSVKVFGANRGIVINDLVRQGLGGEQALILREFGSDALAQRAYIDGGAQMAGMKPKDMAKFEEGIRSRLGQFDQTLIGSAGSAQTRTDRYGALARIAAGYVAQGDNPDHAAARATAEYRDAYAFVGTWRMPANIAGNAWSLGGVTPQQRPKGTSAQDVIAGRSYATNRDAVNRATIAIKNGLAGRTSAVNVLGPGLSRLSDNQAEAQIIGKAIQAQGRWVTLADDSGLALMVPDALAGSWSVVRDKDGQAISYGWDDLAKVGNYALAHSDDHNFAVDERKVLGRK